jgi:Nucleotidyl transferase AbiEii toxin, Type IV TA system
MVISAVLSEIIDEEGVPLFVLTGGVAMELRFRTRARASKDYDAAFRRDLAHLEDVLAQSSYNPVGQFVVNAGAPEPIGPTGAIRLPLKIGYGRKPWATVMLEVSRAEGGSTPPHEIDYQSPSPDLSIFGFEPQRDVPCLPVRY